MAERLVVVGGDAAGMSAASQARKRRPPDDLEIVAFERGSYTSYSACGIPYWIGDVVDGPDALIARRPEEFRERYAIDVRLQSEVVGIDLAARTVEVRDTEAGRTYREGFDQLVLATGAVPVRPPVPGIDAGNVFGVQVLDDGVAVRRAIDAGAKRAVVVGAGYIGIEMAEAMVEHGLAVTVVTRDEQPMATLDPDMGRLVRDAMTDMGIDVRTGELIREIGTDDDGSVASVTTDGGTYDADLVVLGTGVRPNTDLARDAGIALGRSGAICVDLRMRASADGVWAGGDCVESYDIVSRRPVHVPLGTHANKQGRVIGINIGGGYATFPGVVRTAVSKVCTLEIARTGMLEADCVAAGLRFVTATVESTTRAGYYPGASPITVKLLAEVRSGRLLGAQIVGREGAAKRIDALAVALWNEMTVEEMTSLDLSYAPPFSPVWDPVLIAARKAWDAVEDDIQRWHRHTARP
jgi:NADPH-dependent 2,4-dienoyl-CoA reductase/sulfur reductase-like enzyme